jgi:hypothetical protein
MLKKIFISGFILLGIVVGGEARAQVVVKPPVIRDNGFQGKYVSQSEPDPIRISAGEKKTVIVTMKNIGKTTWESSGKNFVSLYTVDPNYRISEFFGPEWRGKSSPAKLEKNVKPGETGEFSITLTAPEQPGDYTEKFYLAAENKTWIKGTGFYFKIIVEPKQVVTDQSATSAPLQTQPETVPVTPSTLDTSSTPFFAALYTRPLIAEPNIRVGLFKTPGTLTFQSEFQYQVYAQDEFLDILNPNEIATLSYQNGEYRIASPGVNGSYQKFLRLIPLDPSNHFTLPGYTRTLSGRKENFNAYRGTLEYRYSPKSAQPYIINELPLDWYVSGVAEASDGVQIEYAKALMVAARSYGYVRIGADIFDVFPNTTDQIYLGYNFEKGSPRMQEAVASTRGEMVTYQGNPVNTPYFSRSNGTTKSAKSAWGQDRAWLQPVEAVYDKGKSMYGHGVGMSNSDALQHAQKDGWNYVQILKQYYTGVEVEKIF